MDWQLLSKSQSAFALIPDQLRLTAEPWALEAGETLFRVGDGVAAMFSVIRGEVRLMRRDRNGMEVILQRAKNGFFAEASLSSLVYHCDAVAAEKTTLIRFPAQRFRDALSEDGKFREAWMAHLARELRKARTQCERLSLHGAADRIVHYLESEGADGCVDLTQTRKAWAAELGLTHEALYRTLKRLEDEGTITVDGAQISLVRIV
ncbi:MAG TPA: Crp/Fnr family transcriptional regulator [Rhodocyclaceae bacterium]|nr:Crp/Fnr family transcriptional regulator [Rhodocyclaceae bacterium]